LSSYTKGKRTLWAYNQNIRAFKGKVLAFEKPFPMPYHMFSLEVILPLFQKNCVIKNQTPI
jgi:hypothetical protein